MGDEKNSRKSLLLAQWSVAIILASVGFLAMRHPVFREGLNPETILTLSNNLGWRGPLVILLYGLLSPLFLIPRWPLAFTCGLLYGVSAGAFIATSASLGGATLQFIFAGTLFASITEKIIRRSSFLQRLPTTGAGAFWSLLALRAFPLSSFVATNLTAGSLRIPARLFIPASFLGMLPSSLMYATWGKLMKKPEVDFYFLAVGLMILIALGSYFMKIKWMNNANPTPENEGTFLEE